MASRWLGRGYLVQEQRCAIPFKILEDILRISGLVEQSVGVDPNPFATWARFGVAVAPSVEGGSIPGPLGQRVFMSSVLAMPGVGGSQHRLTL